LLSGIRKKNAGAPEKLRLCHLAPQQSGQRRVQYSFILFMRNLANGRILIPDDPLYVCPCRRNTIGLNQGKKIG